MLHKSADAATEPVVLPLKCFHKYTHTFALLWLADVCVNLYILVPRNIQETSYCCHSYCSLCLSVSTYTTLRKGFCCCCYCPGYGRQLQNCCSCTYIHVCVNLVVGSTIPYVVVGNVAHTVVVFISLH